MSAKKILPCLALLCHLLCASSSIIVDQSRTQPMKTQDPYGIATVSQSESPKIKCPSSHDPVYGGNLVNCSNLDITSVNEILISDPHKVTTLLLDHNDISCLQDMSLHRMGALRKLSIRDSRVKTIQVNALFGLTYLEVLDLEYNELSLAIPESFPHGMFDHVANVRHLFIAYNMRDSQGNGTYENIDIFSSLPGLQTLSIDAFYYLELDKMFFNNLTELISLTVGCTLTTMLSHYSLIGIQNSTLRTLSLVGFSKPIDFFEYGLFENLPVLDSLTVVNCKVGNQNMMKAMYPFKNRSMSLVHIEGSNYFQNFGTPDNQGADGIIDRKTLKSLLTVCLEKFVWSDSNIFAWKSSTLMYAYTWHSCLKYFDLSKNRLQTFGWRISFFELQPFVNLREFVLSNSLSTSLMTNPSLLNFTLSDASDIKAISDHKSPAEHFDPARGHEPFKPNFSFYLPRSIKVIRLVEIWTGMNILMNVSYIFRGAENLKELYWINNYMTEGSSKFFGFSNLERLDISMSMFLVSLDMFDSLSGLKVFVAKAMRPDAFFDNTPVERIVQKMPNLRYLDVSSNKLDLNHFPPGTFSSVPNLTHLILSKNRLTSVAFDLASTPNLRYLDLSANAILFLDEYDTQALDQHLAKNVPHFTLDLRNNSIACGCEQLPFLVWLYRTEVNVLDKEKLMCTYNDGRVIPVFSIDIMHFWRRCQGRVMLLGSVILLAVMTVAFLIACLINRFRFSLQAYALRLFSDWFRPMEPSDYRIHTFIGYADDDFWFVRHILRVYLEDKLNVTTYIHQRDLEAGSMDQQFFTAITNSWRIVLVLSENFLQRYNMSHLIMKYASHSVSAMNQGRVFVLVEESQLHNIPDYLDSVLDDSKVIVLSDLNSPFDYEQRQRIKDPLRP